MSAKPTVPRINYVVKVQGNPELPCDFTRIDGWKFLKDHVRIYIAEEPGKADLSRDKLSLTFQAPDYKNAKKTFEAIAGVEWVGLAQDRNQLSAQLSEHCEDLSRCCNHWQVIEGPSAYRNNKIVKYTRDFIKPSTVISTVRHRRRAPSASFLYCRESRLSPSIECRNPRFPRTLCYTAPDVSFQAPLEVTPGMSLNTHLGPHGTMSCPYAVTQSPEVPCLCLGSSFEIVTSPSLLLCSIPAEGDYERDHRNFSKSSSNQLQSRLVVDGSLS